MSSLFFRRHNKHLSDMHRTKRSGKRGSHGEKKSKFRRAKFLAWDGEGLQKGDQQVYGLLANSEGHYWLDVNGLSTLSCLYALTDESYTRNTIHVCFGASYDVNMMLGDVPEDVLRELHAGNGRVRWREFDLEYRPRKSFSVTRYKMEERDGKVYRIFDKKRNRYIVERSVTLFDVFGFFQKKFVSVLQEWFRGTRFENKYQTTIEDIKLGKQRRGEFTETEVLSFVLPYCLAECEALRDLMGILHGYIDEAGLVLSRWDGAGAVAAALMKKHNIKQFIRRGPNLEWPAEPAKVTLAAEYAYFGGWIECFKFGHIAPKIMPDGSLRKIKHGDIKSAYPDQEEKLQSLIHGTWQFHEYGKYLPLSELQDWIRSLPSFFVAHIEWQCPDRYKYIPCPFSWRNPSGNVSRPLWGKGWQWSPEILACMDVCPDVQVWVNRIYTFHPTEDVRPFAFIRDIYQARAKHKKEGKGIEKVEKLEMNSTYGKLAQSLGYNSERNTKPPYHCLVYAGLITSGTRAKILRVAMQKPEAIISIATDGIYSLDALDLDIGDDLGQWEYTEHEDMTIVQSGFYWYSTLEDGKIKESHYYRGFNEGSISREDVVRAYQFGELELPVSTTRFVTLGSAIGLNNFSIWRTWRTIDRMLDLWMQRSSKRVWLGELDKTDPHIMLSRVRQIDPYFFEDNPEALESSKYSFDWDEYAIDGISARELAEELFTQELCTDE